MRFLMLLIPTALPLMKMAVLIIGGRSTTIAFTERTQKVIDQFEGQDSYGAKVNVKLTVSENVADLGGIAAALEAAKKEADFSAEEFFTNFARIWRMKGREEYMKLLASVDVHAPAKLRTNVQLPNFDDFFTTFDVQEGDGM